MTKFSFEVPIQHLDDFDDLQDFYFTLSYLYNDPKYKYFMQLQAEKGLRTVWLDNSYNEKLEADNPMDLIKLAAEVGAHKVVCPDDPKWDTYQILNSFHFMARYLPTDKLVVVVSNQDMMSKAIRQGVRHCAYPFRTRLERTLEQNSWGSSLHFLGMTTPSELVALNPPSCDTGLPIKIALKGWKFEEWLDKGAPHIYTHSEFPDYYNMILKDWQIDLARANIIALTVFLQEGRL